MTRLLNFVYLTYNNTIMYLILYLLSQICVKYNYCTSVAPNELGKIIFSNYIVKDPGHTCIRLVTTKGYRKFQVKSIPTHK